MREVEKRESDATIVDQPFRRAKTGLGILAASIATLPLATTIGFNTTKTTESIDLLGGNTFTISPTVNGRLTLDTGIVGKASVVSHSWLGADIIMQGTPFGTESEVANNGKKNSVIESTANSLYRLSDESFQSMQAEISDSLFADFLKKTALTEGLLLGAILLLRKKQLTRQQLASLLVGINTALLLPGGESARSNQAHEPLYTTYQSSYVGDIHIYDKGLNDILHNVLPAVEGMRERQIEKNTEFVAAVTDQLPLLTPEVFGSQPLNTKLIAITSDIHTTQTMLTINQKLNALLQPSLTLDAGDLTNYDFTAEMFAAEMLSPDIAVIGNHDGQNVIEALQKTETLVAGEPEIFEVSIDDDNDPVRVLTAEDPRRTTPGANGTPERSENSIANMHEKLLERAREGDIDIVLLHNPSDIQFLIDNNVAFKLAVSGHTHEEGIVEAKDGLWLQAGTTGGITARSIESFLTPLATPSKDATIHYVAIDQTDHSIKMIYEFTISPDAQATLQTHSYTQIPPKKGGVSQP